MKKSLRQKFEYHLPILKKIKNLRELDRERTAESWFNVGPTGMVGITARQMVLSYSQGLDSVHTRFPWTRVIQGL